MTIDAIDTFTGGAAVRWIGIHPFVVLADVESITVPMDVEQVDPASAL